MTGWMQGDIMKSSRTMKMVREAVCSYPGKTAHWYDRHVLTGRAVRSRTYEAFRSAVKHGLIHNELHPLRSDWTVYYPSVQK